VDAARKPFAGFSLDAFDGGRHDRSGMTLISPDGLRALEHQRLRSLRDPDLALAHELHADDYQLINPYGQTIDKEDYLSGIATGEIRYHAFEPISAIQVRVGERMSIVRYSVRIDIEAFGGRERLVCWHTDSWELQDRWRAVWSQATAIVD
jgi:Domain of unknown function (DUF4440)